MEIKYLNGSGSTVFHYGKTPYITFKSFDGMDFIRHGCSTRLGGVSGGIYESMNLSFTRGDRPESVSRNFELIGEALDIGTEDMVYAMQTHTANVMEAGPKHRGMGVLRPRDYSDIDGFVTDKPGVALVITFADCVSVFLADPVKKAIGLVHSGWRGTVGNIAAAAVDRLAALYGSNPGDIVAFVGPSICRGCYEVGEDVAERFAAVYGEAAFLKGILSPAMPFGSSGPSAPSDLLNLSAPSDPLNLSASSAPWNGKFLLDLHRANRLNLLNAGLREENIGLTDICTCCNPGLLFSHRASRGERGGCCGFLQIKDSRDF